jgi:hypothetical protein
MLRRLAPLTSLAVLFMSASVVFAEHELQRRYQLSAEASGQNPSSLFVSPLFGDLYLVRRQQLSPNGQAQQQLGFAVRRGNQLDMVIQSAPVIGLSGRLQGEQGSGARFVKACLTLPAEGQAARYQEQDRQALEATASSDRGAGSWTPASAPTADTENASHASPAAPDVNAPLGDGADDERHADLDELDRPMVAARRAVAQAFKERFFEADGSPRAAFTQSFDPDGPQSWAEVRPTIRADAERFGLDESYAEGYLTTFTGRIFGLYTEVTVDQDGVVKKTYFELD